MMHSLTFRSVGVVWTVWRRKIGIINLIGHQLLVAFDRTTLNYGKELYTLATKEQDQRRIQGWFLC